MPEVQNYITNPHWNTSRKVTSREDSIIQPYKQLFSLSSIPPHTQYWTMCGAHYTGTQESNDYQPIDGEFGQLLSEGLFLDPSQFHGVDHNPDIIRTNETFYPGVNWHCGDFLTTLKEYHTDNPATCRPAIINFDNVREPPRGAGQLKALISFIDSNLSDPLMLTANFLMHNPRAPRRVYDALGVVNRLANSLANHWQIYPEYYEYIGGAAEQSRSIMGTFIFIKEEHRGAPTYTEKRNLIANKDLVLTSVR